MKLYSIISCALFYCVITSFKVMGQNDSVSCYYIGSFSNEFSTYFINSEVTTYHNEDYLFLPLNFAIHFPHPNVKWYVIGESDNYLFLLDSSSCVFLTYDYTSSVNDTLFEINDDELSNMIMDEYIREKMDFVMNNNKTTNKFFCAYKNDIKLIFINVDLSDIKRVVQSFCILRKQEKKRIH